MHDWALYNGTTGSALKAFGDRIEITWGNIFDNMDSNSDVELNEGAGETVDEEGANPQGDDQDDA